VSDVSDVSDMNDVSDCKGLATIKEQFFSEDFPKSL